MIGRNSILEIAVTGCLCSFCGLGLVAAAAAVRLFRSNAPIDCLLETSHVSPSVIYLQRVVANNREETAVCS